MKNVLEHHETSTRSASISSSKAKSAMRVTRKSIRSAYETIETFDKEVHKFDIGMKKVL